MAEDLKQPVATRGWLLSFFRRAVIPGAVIAGGIIVGVPGLLNPDDDASDAVTRLKTSAEGSGANPAEEKPSFAPGNALPGKFFGRLHLHSDGTGRIVPDSTLRELFDAIRHLDTNDPPDKNRMRRHLSDEGRKHALTAQQLLELDRIFARYLDYLEHSANANAQNAPAYHDINALRTALAVQHETRRNMLGQDVANGFFGDSEAGDRQTLRHLENYALPAGQRAENASAISSTVIDRNRTEGHVGADPVDLVALHEKVEQMRQSGAGQEQIDAVRRAALGAEIAERFSLADRDASAVRHENPSAAPFQLSK